MSHYETLLVAVIGSFLASSGFWAYIASRNSKKSATTKLLLGLAYERLNYLSITVIDRGHIYSDEYDDIRRYLYEPYKALGGNGSADRLMSELGKIPIRSHRHHKEGEELDGRD